MPLAEAVRATGTRVQVAVGHPFAGNLPLPTVLGTDLDPTAVQVPARTRERFPAVADELGIPAVVFSVFQYFPSMLDLPAVTRRALDQPDVDPWAPLAQPALVRPYLDPVPAALQVGPIAEHPDVILEAARVGNVIASAGPIQATDTPGDLPANVAVHRFVPTRAVLAAADLVVYHGGMGTTLAAAAYGVPQLVLPQAGDQFANATAVTGARPGR